MSDEGTRDLNSGRSFEERVFARFDAIDNRFNAIENRFDAIDNRFNAIDNRFDEIDNWRDEMDHWRGEVFNRLDGINSRVERLEIANEKRALETRPIWERILTEIGEMKDSIIELNRKVDVLNRDLLTVKANQMWLDDRLHKIEQRPI
jgi:archaellum component FlaC